MSFLDDIPVASVTFIASLVCIVIAYISNDLSLEDAFEAIALAGGGSFGIGYVRNQAGRGVKR
jgi:hypothetical protein